MIRSCEEVGWSLQFNDLINITELKRSFPQHYFTSGRVEVPNRNLLGAVLARAALLAESLPSQPLNSFNFQVHAFLAENPSLAGTEKEAVVRQRIGQGLYRNALLGYWNDCCAVTGIDVPEILRASHAKPWADCESDAERLDVFNGFLLTANLDALFDCGLISFDEDGNMLFAGTFPSYARDPLGLEGSPRLRWIASEHQRYLRWHREQVFLGG